MPDVTISQNEADFFYAELLDSHRELDEKQSTELNARLILLMAEEIGDATKLVSLIRQARQSI